MILVDESAVLVEAIRVTRRQQVNPRLIPVLDDAARRALGRRSLELGLHPARAVGHPVRRSGHRLELHSG